MKSTQQITKAMKMVAAARLRRMQLRILAARPFAQRMRELIDELAGRLVVQERGSPNPPHPSLGGLGQGPQTPLWGERIEVRGGVQALHPFFRPGDLSKQAILLITSDKGLCGAFNTNLIRKTLEYLGQHPQEEVQLFVVGRKGRDFFRRQRVKIAKEYTGLLNQLSYAHAELIGKDLIEGFLSEAFSEVSLIYQEFKSALRRRVVVEPLLPISLPPLEGEGRVGESGATAPTPRTKVLPHWDGRRGGCPERGAEAPVDFLYEPAREQLLEALLPRHVKAQIYRALLESTASELGARLTAMDQATENAGELIDTLTLRMNRTRQASITKEILEVVAGAEVLA
ncbi:MAG: ATP synthase F1 subunit gamma [Elusimicrobia bacterium]|nr:ATP synthase F1 subunit gamma [Elusimicrobiota bacterium]